MIVLLLKILLFLVGFTVRQQQKKTNFQTKCKAKVCKVSRILGCEDHEKTYYHVTDMFMRTAYVTLKQIVHKTEVTSCITSQGHTLSFWLFFFFLV